MTILGVTLNLWQWLGIDFFIALHLVLYAQAARKLLADWRRSRPIAQCPQVTVKAFTDETSSAEIEILGIPLFVEYTEGYVQIFDWQRQQLLTRLTGEDARQLMQAIREGS